jgi:hypothetical protein
MGQVIVSINNYQDHLPVRIDDPCDHPNIPNKVCFACDGQGLIQELKQDNSKRGYPYNQYYALAVSLATYTDGSSYYVPYGDCPGNPYQECPICNGIGRLYLDLLDMKYKRIDEHIAYTSNK